MAGNAVGNGKLAEMKDLKIKAIKAATDAGKAILKIYNNGFEITYKEDASPLTEADEASNTIINEALADFDIPLISEENRQIEYTERKNWTNCWIVDPLDGTKEFIKKNGEFTVNIALCIDGRPSFGVIYVPVKRELYYGDVERGMAFKIILDEDHNLPDQFYSPEDQIYPTKPQDNLLKVVASRSHLNRATLQYIESAKNRFEEIEIVSTGSSLKFCLVAEGKAHVYPRYAPTMEWDTAAGQAICEAVGLSVISQDTRQGLRYNKENLLNPYFIVQH